MFLCMGSGAVRPSLKSIEKVNPVSLHRLWGWKALQASKQAGVGRRQGKQMLGYHFVARQEEVWFSALQRAEVVALARKEVKGVTWPLNPQKIWKQNSITAKLAFL